MATERMGDGGPAFPRPMSVSHGGVSEHEQYAWEQDGMTLRDYFAAKAMASFCTTAAHPSQQDADYIAKCAYIQADAMLAARSQP